MHCLHMANKARLTPRLAAHPRSWLNGRLRRHTEQRRLRRLRYNAIIRALGGRDWEHGVQQRLASELGVSHVCIVYDVQRLRAAGLLPPKDMPYETWRLSQTMQAISQSLDKRDDEMAALRAEVSELRARLAAEKQATE